MGGARAKVTVLNAYAVHPVENGGANRMHWLYKTLAENVDVDLVTLGTRQHGSGVERVAPGLRELRVARTVRHEIADRALQQETHAPVFDIAALENISLTPDYLAVLENSLAGSRLAVLAHPYMLTALRAVRYAGALAHESQNCEHALKTRILPPGAMSERLLNLVEEAEGFCCREARLVYACSDDDARGLLEEYGGPSRDTIVVPNGSDTTAIRYCDSRERVRVRARLGMDARPVALFLGSGHRPNLEAAEHLFRLAERMPHVDFAFVGNIQGAFSGRSFAPNVRFVGFVSDEVRNIWLQLASVALNPMLYGGGTNLKLLDYFAAGTPVVSTEVGVRGIGAVSDEHVLVAEIEGLEEAIARAIAGGPRIEAMTRNARELVETRFDWHGLGTRLHAAMMERDLL